MRFGAGQGMLCSGGTGARKAGLGPKQASAFQSSAARRRRRPATGAPCNSKHPTRDSRHEVSEFLPPPEKVIPYFAAIPMWGSNRKKEASWCLSN